MDESFQYPWYFESNNMFEAWDISQGEHITVAVADTCIDIHHVMLAEKALYADDNTCNYKIKKDYAELSDIFQTIKNMQDTKSNLDLLTKKFAKIYPNYIHGTAMASLIVGSLSILKKDPFVSLPQEYGDKICVAGIAPKSKIIGLEGVNVGSLEKGFTIVKEKTAESKPLFKDKKRIQVVLINLSGGEKAKDEEDFSLMASSWKDFARRVCTDQENTLIISAVGNDRLELTKNSQKQGVLPAVIKPPKICHGKDPILRVGATNFYLQGDKVDKYKNSNYGAEFVEILAPGAGIPIATPKNYSSIASGTSEATAITTGIAALLANCRPFTTAEAIKNAILQHATHYDHLKSYVLNGNVINAKNSLKHFCFNIENTKENNNLYKTYHSQEIF